MHVQPATHLWIRQLLIGVACLAIAAPLPAADEPAPRGIRQIASRHLMLFTDLPPDDDVDALPAMFDQAYPQWCAYFGLDAGQHANWRVRGHLMHSRERFEAAGLLPAGLPPFKTGYALGDALWIYDQTSQYYRRHLLLHEGTHAFMHALTGGVGPAWYAEGVAELLGTHRLDEGRLTLNVFPASPDDVLKWGRIEIVQTDFAARRAKTLEKLFNYNPRVDGENEWYGWCWAAAAFFDGHPRYRTRFRQLPKLVAAADFTDQMRATFGDEWSRVAEDWQLFVANVDYGYDFSRMEVDAVPSRPLAAAGAVVTLAADRGWQSAGVRLEAGKRYRLHASGRYQVDNHPRAWWCEPNGVTIRYYRGQPLGIVLAAVRSDEAEPRGASGLIRPIVVGLETTLTAPRDGTLYLRINDSAGSLANNAGSFQVEVVPE